MSDDDRYSMREETEKFRALQIELMANENYLNLTKRIRELEAALRTIATGGCNGEMDCQRVATVALAPQEPT